MAKLIRVGFFREMPHGEPSDPSLAEAHAPAPAAQQNALASNLAAGHVYIATPGLTKEVVGAAPRLG